MPQLSQMQMQAVVDAVIVLLHLSALILVCADGSLQHVSATVYLRAFSQLLVG